MKQLLKDLSKESKMETESTVLISPKVSTLEAIIYWMEQRLKSGILDNGALVVDVTKPHLNVLEMVLGKHVKKMEEKRSN